MNAKELQESLSIRDVYSLVEYLGGNPQEKNGTTLNIQTICHNHDGSGNYNLRYYSDSCNAYCFSNCGHMSIYDLVGEVLNLDFYNSFKFVMEYFGYSMYDIQIKTEAYKDKNDIDFFNRDTITEKEMLNEIDNNVMNIYYPLYYQGWINEGISIRTMKKFNIQTSIVNEQIIIPHYDENGRLVGVRCRNLNSDLVAEGKKYMPVINSGKMLNHSTGSILYGLNFNKENINNVRKVILFESEKAVMQLDSFMPDMSIGVCLSGGNLTNRQVDILKGLNIDEVIVGIDKEFNKIGDNEEKYYAKKIEETFVKKLGMIVSVSVLWDTKGLLNKKDAPTDRGAEVFKELFNNRIRLN